MHNFGRVNVVVARWLVLLFALAVSACGGGDDSPQVVSSRIIDKGPIFRTLEVSTSRAGGVEVEYGFDGSKRLRVVSASGAATAHEVLLPRLVANKLYSYSVYTTLNGQRGGERSSGVFQTGELPAELKAIAATTSGSPTLPLTFLAMRSDFKGGIVLDAEGNVVWYAKTSIAPQGATQRANGNWVILLNGVGLAEFSPLGEQVSFLSQSRLPETIHHGVTATSRNTLIFLTFDPRTFDGQTLRGEGIWEWNPQDDSLLKRWSAFDHLDPTVDFGVRSVPNDWFHANSIAIGQRGNIVLSFHFLDQILSLTPDFSAIEWRLGGPGSTYEVGAPQMTSGQHSAREVASNEILMFDNGFARAGGERYSRAIQLQFDPASGNVVTTWQYRPQPDIWATVISSVRILGNGHRVLLFGTPAGINGSTGPIALHEVSATGELKWAMTLSLPAGSTVFQGDPMRSIAGEQFVD